MQTALRHRVLFALTPLALCLLHAGAASAQTVPGAIPGLNTAVPGGLGLPEAFQGNETGGALAAPLDAASAPVPRGNFVQPSLGMSVVQTSNAYFGTSTPAKSDTIISITPGIAFQTEGPDLRTFGNFALNAQYYARGSYSNTVLPSGVLGLSARLVDQWLYFDAGITSQQNALLTIPAQGTGTATYTTTQYRVSPYIDHRFDDNLRLRARSDNTWTHISGNQTGQALSNGRYSVQSVQLDRRPTPFGWGLDARQEETVYTTSGSLTVRDEIARARALYAFTPHFEAGLIGGYEHYSTSYDSLGHSIYGVQARWQPNVFTRVDGVVERRFFGTGWNVNASQQIARLSLRLNWNRAPSSFLAGLQTIPSGVSLSNLLDGMLASQYPDPAARARAVQNLLSVTGLPSTLPNAINYYTQSATLQDTLTATAVLLDQRNSYAASLFHTKTQDLILPGSKPLNNLLLASADYVQNGVGLSYGRRLTPVMSLNVGVLRALNTGFGLNTGVSIRQTTFIVQVSRRLSPKTLLVVGARRQLLDTANTGILNANESAIYAGLTHQF
ncbi:MAG: TIGR03016 family PEP-CTERM system-associated outer membrane protein [Pseudomonadota bacterium]